MDEWKVDIREGDVINVRGPSVPEELQDKFWRVRAIWPKYIDLDGPYEDEKATVRYKSKGWGDHG